MPDSKSVTAACNNHRSSVCDVQLLLHQKFIDFYVEAQETLKITTNHDKRQNSRFP